MSAQRDENWCRSLTSKHVGKLTLHNFIGAGKIGYVYRASLIEFPDAIRAVKLTFDQLKEGWEIELKKVTSLDRIEGVVHFHDLGAQTITHEGRSHLCQYTVWDFIPPGENLKQYLKRVQAIDAGFLLAVVERVLRVLHACQVTGVPRHGDLHAGNILIGTPTDASLDETLRPRAEIYVSDFGYGGTGGAIKAKTITRVSPGSSTR